MEETFIVSTIKSLPGLLLCEFTDIKIMDSYLGGFSTEQEGFIPGRIGHNIPMDTIHSYMLKIKNHSTSKNNSSVEQRFIYNLIKEKYPETKYIIGYKKGDILTKKHEFQHAKYFLNPSFREEVNLLWFSLSSSIRQKYIDYLIMLGYPPETHIDEFQAYYFTGELCFH
jgi:hypothetical protein